MSSARISALAKHSQIMDRLNQNLTVCYGGASDFVKQLRLRTDARTGFVDFPKAVLPLENNSEPNNEYASP